MIYEVENKTTGRSYTVDENVFKTLDMKRKFKLLSSWDETKKNRIAIPVEIQKSMMGGLKEKVKHQIKAEIKNDIND